MDASKILHLEHDGETHQFVTLGEYEAMARIADEWRDRFDMVTKAMSRMEEDWKSYVDKHI